MYGDEKVYSELENMVFSQTTEQIPNQIIQQIWLLSDCFYGWKASQQKESWVIKIW